MGLFVQDFQPLETSTVTPEVNIINTIDEYIAEIVFDYKDAMPEAKDHSKKDIQIHKHSVLKLINLVRPSFVCTVHMLPTSFLPVFFDKYSYQFYEDIIPPPPKQLS